MTLADHKKTLKIKAPQDRVELVGSVPTRRPYTKRLQRAWASSATRQHADFTTNASSPPRRPRLLSATAPDYIMSKRMA